MAVKNIEIEMRVTELEAKVQRLEQQLVTQASHKTPWWEHVVGAFADDPDFLEAMRLGREYRESLRPKAPRRSKSSKQPKA
jgi:hypothetical protein